jgi:hypothetical protein
LALVVQQQLIALETTVAIQFLAHLLQRAAAAAAVGALLLVVETVVLAVALETMQTLLQTAELQLLDKDLLVAMQLLQAKLLEVAVAQVKQDLMVMLL